MDRYALDASAICEDFLFLRNPARLLLREARAGRIAVLVPQIAFDETVTKFRDAVGEHGREARRGLNRLRGLESAGAVDLAGLPTPEEAAAEYAARLRAVLEAARAQFLPYPQIGHDVIAMRAMARRKPFDTHGKDGYRDTLFWETLKAVAADPDPIVIVSGDKAAFGKARNELATDLQDEIGAAGFSRDAIRRIGQISDFTSTLPAIEAVLLEVEHELALRQHLVDAIEWSITEEALDYDESQTSLIGLPLEIDQLYVDSVNQVREITVVSAHELEDKRAAIALTADCDMTFEVYVRKSDAYAYEGEDFRITDLDYNDSFVQGVVRRLVEAEIDAVYDRDAREFTSITTYNFTPFDEA